jgi:hypothetical protein
MLIRKLSVKGRHDMSCRLLSPQHSELPLPVGVSSFEFSLPGISTADAAIAMKIRSFILFLGSMQAWPISNGHYCPNRRRNLNFAKATPARAKFRMPVPYSNHAYRVG